MPNNGDGALQLYNFFDLHRINNIERVIRTLVVPNRIVLSRRGYASDAQKNKVAVQLVQLFGPFAGEVGLPVTRRWYKSKTIVLIGTIEAGLTATAMGRFSCPPGPWDRPSAVHIANNPPTQLQLQTNGSESESEN
jgi:hypothetical protein